MKLKTVQEEYIIFDNGTTVTTEHFQECCESHYADFSVLYHYNVDTKTGKTIQMNQVEFPEDLINSIVLVKDMGFNLIAKNGSVFFIPCYADNNGYYNSDLTLVICNNEKTQTLDIQDCQQWI
jgi:hypothetical protein